MPKKQLFLAVSAIALAMSVGCIRSYNAAPLSNTSFNKEAKTDLVVLKLKAFLTPEEVSEKFGSWLADERAVVPVQVQLINLGADSFKVLRASFVLEQLGTKTRLDALSAQQAYDLGRFGYGAPITGMVFGGILGLPSLITTVNSNDRIREDYGRKMLNEAILEPGKDTMGVLFFDPSVKKLNRYDKFKLVVELENTKTGTKLLVEQPLA